jgi:hypothetical protein
MEAYSPWHRARSSGEWEKKEKEKGKKKPTR